ncbi:STAS domain-containing protein [Streptomyces sp. NPDC096013]|uniref:STAS domain-containing protein n=1 Tax=Streptomyces sp. NPDC096013 TaxID=3366069 RepID=UPI0037F7B9BC
MELDEVIDPDTKDTVERELERLIRTAGTSVVIVDIRTPLLTSTALQLLLSVRRTAGKQGTVLCVAARRPLARRVLQAAGLTRALRVTTTVGAASALARGCPPVHHREDVPDEGAGQPTLVCRTTGRHLFL